MPDPTFMDTFTGPQGLPGTADDQSVADLVNTPSTTTTANLSAQYLSTAQVVISPTAPSNPAVGTVWINNT